MTSVVYDCNPTLSTVAGREDRAVRTVARVLSLDGELERDQRCLVVKRKKVCEEDRKAAGREETTKGGGEGLTRTSAESVLSQ